MTPSRTPNGTPRPRRPRLGRRVVRGLGILLRAQDGNLLLAAETARRRSRDDYQVAVLYLERLVAWAGKGGPRPSHHGKE